ncbi:MAG: NAD(P)/FAD-dependent oxidoreductase [Clostridium sp.]|uniref:NAD(P)/FAD-dependent oxidoreductase n=1 Tax=Clostridium sp. TaxID=1506 RepID=UPI002A8A24DB|nr:NAD(P)/FAD-dependent oxidoreductase [Clostridium sp.]MDY5098326.1 NAD(P)/FAD-dependent oxidoreductase [Clostridium sp.]
MFDVIIIGAGVIGSAVAREMSRYNLKTCVLEKNNDVSDGTTKANSAIIHAGYDAKPHTLKGRLNARGNAMFDKLKEELDFPFKRNGSLVVCFDKNDIPELERLKAQGEANGVPGIRILERKELLEMEPNISHKAQGALYAPTGGIICPYSFAISLAENASENGVEFKLETKVMNIEKKDGYYNVTTDKGDFEGKVVINAAGVYADEINNMVSEHKMKIVPRKGEYCLCDNTVGNLISKTVFQLPTKLGKGVLITPTIDGNLLIGPNAEDIDDKDDLTTTKEGLDFVLEKAKLTMNPLPLSHIITSFSGLRARNVEGDFIIGEREDAKNFINAAGIESPGLSSAPAIAEMVKDIVVENLNPKENENFNPVTKAIPRFREMSLEERKALIKTNPKYGTIICRCECVTEGEIMDAIHRPLGATTLDGVKKRTRTMMGGCQGGYCSSPILNILARELNIAKTEVKKGADKSNILIGENKENL